jgi:hypothetical protein
MSSSGRHLIPALTGTLLALTAVSAQTADARLGDAFAQGKVSLNARVRYEHAEQTGLRNSDALTLRTRLGFTTAPVEGLRGMLEMENVTALDPDSYNQGGLNVPGAGAGRVVIADPEVTEVNQAWLSYTTGTTSVTAGRQRIVLDNARFIGDVGWRQDQQTFDAVTLSSKAVARLNLTYGYLWQINRIFAERLDWDSDSHLFNASYTAGAAGTIGAYGYLLDFDNARANSSQTYGLSLSNLRPLEADLKLSYRLEYARQSDYGSSPLRYETDYRLAEIGLVGGRWNAKAGYERLGSDRNVGFRTPLATLHAFNGWADMFLATPAGGLENLYLSVGAVPKKGLNLTAVYHWFEAARGNASYGTEFDLLASYALTPRLTFLAKYANFDPDTPAYRDTERITLELTFVY